MSVSLDLWLWITFEINKDRSYGPLPKFQKIPWWFWYADITELSDISYPFYDILVLTEQKKSMFKQFFWDSGTGPKVISWNTSCLEKWICSNCWLHSRLEGRLHSRVRNTTYHSAKQMGFRPDKLNDFDFHIPFENNSLFVFFQNNRPFLLFECPGIRRVY